jgi:AhpD family alkylhydroperoxidase
MKQKTTFNLTVTETAARCPIGEVIGKRNAEDGAIPVLSCEGACIRGEIARLAAGRVAKVAGYRRGCHGELFAVPESAMASWVRDARQVVVIDGCHLKCHARIIEHLAPRTRLRSFDALARYRKYTDLFDIDAVPEAERKAIADDVAEWVLGQLRQAPALAAAATNATCPGTETAETASTARDEKVGGCSASGDRPASQFSSQVRDLVGIGASVAANCEPCLEHHVHEAERHGISRADMNRAVALGARVKDAPHRKVLAAAERLTGASPAAGRASQDGSNCSSASASKADSTAGCG